MDTLCKEQVGRILSGERIKGKKLKPFWDKAGEDDDLNIKCFLF